MDYWKFMQHGLFGKGSARKNHKYYQRVEVGTDRNGNTEYYYFYSKEAYDNYQRSRAIGRGEDPEKTPTRAQQKEWAKQKILNGKSRLTGAYRRERHPNGRGAWVATEEYEDTDGKLKLHKKYISGDDEVTRLRDNMYRKKRAEAETSKEKKARMKAAKKRYNKKMSEARRKRAVQKGAQRVAKLLVRKLTLQGK